MARPYASSGDCGRGQGGARWAMGFTSYMDIALDEARAAAARGEVPVGAR